MLAQPEDKYVVNSLSLVNDLAKSSFLLKIRVDETREDFFLKP